MADRILIWGAGAIGGTIGVILSQAGHDVTFVDQASEHVAAINERGFRVTGPIVETVAHARAFLPDQLTGTWDHIYLCVKGQDTSAAARALAPHLATQGYVLSLQNGLCEELIAAVVGAPRVIGAFINYGADWQAPGEIMFANHGAFVIGEIDGRITPRLEHLHGVVRDFCADAMMTDDINSFLWGKLGYACFLFAQALGQLGIADCLARPELLELWRRLGSEVNAVAAALGIAPRGFNGYDPAAFTGTATEPQAAASVAAMVAFNRPNLKTHSGIWRDIAVRKRRTEVDVQIAPIARLGAQHGVACPTIERLVDLIHQAETRILPLADDNLLLLAGEGKS